MRTRTKLMLGCGGVGSLSILGLVLLAALIPDDFVAEAERRGREHRQQQEREEQAAKEAEEEARKAREVAEYQETLSRYQEGFEQARRRFEASLVPGADGQPLMLWDVVTHAATGGDISEYAGRIFPAPAAPSWAVSQNLDGYAIYRFRYPTRGVLSEVQIAVRSAPVMQGQALPAACYKYLGMIEARNLIGNPVPVMSFERLGIEDPPCR